MELFLSILETHLMWIISLLKWCVSRTLIIFKIDRRSLSNLYLFLDDQSYVSNHTHHFYLFRWVSLKDDVCDIYSLMNLKGEFNTYSWSFFCVNSILWMILLWDSIFIYSFSESFIKNKENDDKVKIQRMNRSLWNIISSLFF